MSAKRARKNDAEWFARHPERNVRFRNPLPGELRETFGPNVKPELEGYPARIAVTQLRPGLRTRRVAYTHLLDDPEPILLAFLAMVESADEQGFSGEVSADDIALVALGEASGIARH